MGEGCLVDQLIGQYLADAAGLGPLLDAAHIRKTLESIYRYNFKRNMFQHDSVQRVYVLNDEAGLVVCDYAKAERPRIPFPYYAEAWTGMEYSTGSADDFRRPGARGRGVLRKRAAALRWRAAQSVGRSRSAAITTRAPCRRGPAYWRYSGFRYDGPRQTVAIAPAAAASADFRCFWSTATGWGVFARRESAGRTAFRLRVDHGALPAQNFELNAHGTKATRHAGRRGSAARLRSRQGSGARAPSCVSIGRSP